MTFKAVRRMLQRRLSKIVYRTPIEHIAAFLLALSTVVGILLLIEPAWSLRFRRGTRCWKIVQIFCGARWFQTAVDAIFRLGRIPTVEVLLFIVRGVTTALLFPFVAFMTAVTNTVISRSVIILVGFPTTLLTLCCKLPVHIRRRLPGLNFVMTWVLTTTIVLLCALHERSQALVHWAVSDISMQLYLALLAIVLTVTMVQERLTVPSLDKSQKKKCHQYVKTFSLYMLAAVVALWILRLSDSKYAALEVLRNVHLMRGA